MSGFYRFQSLEEYFKSSRDVFHKNKLKQRLVELSEYFNVSPIVSDLDLHKTARVLIVRYHPDKPDGDLEKFNEAYNNFDELREIRSYIYDDLLLPVVISNK